MNTVMGTALPKTKSALLVIHMLGFFRVSIPLVYLAPYGDAHNVFASFINEGTWGAQGFTFRIAFLLWRRCTGSTKLPSEVSPSEHAKRQSIRERWKAYQGAMEDSWSFQHRGERLCVHIPHRHLLPCNLAVYNSGDTVDYELQLLGSGRHSDI